MKLQCVSNESPDSDIDYTFTNLTVGNVYIGAIVCGDEDDDYFLCFDDAGEWQSYYLSLFEPLPE